MATKTTSQKKLTSPARQRSVDSVTSKLDELAAHSTSLLSKPCARFDSNGETYQIPRYVFLGASGGDDPIRIGIFAGIHGDQPETSHAAERLLTILDQRPELAKDFCLFVYPICNPSGFEDGTRYSRRGRDLNREFWNNSNEPEVAILQSELYSHAFDGIITLHADEASTGLYGFVKSLSFARELLEPALAAAEAVLPRNDSSIIDGFPAARGIIRDSFAGAISAPPKIRPRPFEIALCTPQVAPQYQQEQAIVAAIQTILVQYRQFIAYARNL